MTRTKTRWRPFLPLVFRIPEPETPKNNNGQIPKTRLSVLHHLLFQTAVVGSVQLGLAPHSSFHHCFISCTCSWSATSPFPVLFLRAPLDMNLALFLLAAVWTFLEMVINSISFEVKANGRFEKVSVFATLKGILYKIFLIFKDVERIKTCLQKEPCGFRISGKQTLYYLNNKSWIFKCLMVIFRGLV